MIEHLQNTNELVSPVSLFTIASVNLNNASKCITHMYKYQGFATHILGEYTHVIDKQLNMLLQCLYIFHSTLLCHLLDYTDPTSCVRLRDFPHAAAYGSLADFRRPSTTSGSALSRNVVVRISFYLGKSLKPTDTANTLTERLLNKPLHVSIFFVCSLYCFRLDFVSNPLH